MKKVLVIAPYAYIPYFSGGQKSIAQFLDYLGMQTDLLVVSVKENDFTLAKTYRAIPLLKKGFTRYIDLSLVRKISDIVRENNISTVIWEHPYYAWLAFRVRKKTGVKTIFHTHNIEYMRFRSTGRWWWPILRWYEKRCFRKADTIFFISKEDMDFATGKWNIPPQKCVQLAFGVEIAQHPDDRAACRNELLRLHSIRPEERILLFNGLLNYKPNLDALKVILDHINPALMKTGFRYKIIICGKGLPESFNNLADYASANIIYTGFVDDILLYFKGADMFLSPILSGGGVKTKMVEAIAFGTTVIATENSAMGIDRAACGEKLLVIPDHDWNAMVNAIVQYPAKETTTPESFYNMYNWKKIVEKAVSVIQ